MVQLLVVIISSIIITIFIFIVSVSIIIDSQ